MSSGPTIDGGGGPGDREMPGVDIALAFATEFSGNAAIFLRAVSALGIVVQTVNTHENRLVSLEGGYNSLNGRVGSLEAQVGEIESQEAEIERLTAELENCGDDSIRDAGDTEAALVGDNIPPEITGSGPS